MVLKIVLFCVLLAVLCAAVLGVYVWRQLGAGPSEEELQSYSGLPYFQNGRFVSRTDVSVYPERVEGGGSMLKLFLPQKNVGPRHMPMHKLQRDSFAQTPAQLAVYWLGHSSLVVELAGKRLLIDPVLGNAAPVPFLFGRYAPAPLKRADIPPVDYVLVTHNHYDHLEAATLRALKDRDAVFIAPLGVGAALRSFGVPEGKIRQLAWGESYKEGPLSITAGETGHYSNRRPGDKNQTLWASYILEGAGKKVYVSGDTGYDADLYQNVGRQYGPFDLAFIEIDAWNAGWPGIHLFPQQAVQLARDIRAKEFIPVHWGVFNLGRHPWSESVEKVSALAAQNQVKMASPLMGQKYIPGQTQTGPWWRGVK